MRFAKAAALVLTATLLSCVLARPARAEVSFDFFYSNLSPHGSWAVSAEYGRVWQPSVYEPGWNPYYDGHWVNTDLGWTWVSDYDWGSVPYHYGTWTLDPGIGWVWVPGYVWAPSWVVFRTGPDYIGWAPVAPGFSIGVSVGFVEPVPERFIFVSSRDFVAPRVRTCILPEGRTTVIINRTKIVNNITIEKNVVVNRGPDVRIVERASGRRLRTVPIERVARVAPGPHVTRAAFAVDPQKAKHGLRAAEPVSAKEPLPVAPGNRREGREPRVKESPAVRPNPANTGRDRIESKHGRETSDAAAPRHRPQPPAEGEIDRRRQPAAPSRGSEAEAGQNAREQDTRERDARERGNPPREAPAVRGPGRPEAPPRAAAPAKAAKQKDKEKKDKDKDKQPKD